MSLKSSTDFDNLSPGCTLRCLGWEEGGDSAGWDNVAKLSWGSLLAVAANL